MQNKKPCFILYGQPNRGKSTTWDRVLGYSNDEGLSTGIRHLPDGFYNFENLTKEKLTVLLIGQSLEETGRIKDEDLFDEIKTILRKQQYDLLFISVQAKGTKNQKTLEFLRTEFENLNLYTIGKIGARSNPIIDPIEQLLIVIPDNLIQAGANAQRILNRIRELLSI